MKLRVPDQKIAALTMIEAAVVVAVLTILVAMLLPALMPYHHVHTVNCVNNLKRVGLSFRIWSGDNNDKYPMEVSVTNGGTMELVATGNVVATFQVMSNELSTPKVIWCLDQKAATSFTTDLDNSRISYCIGLDATGNHPQGILSGDANFETGGIPVKSGLLELSTNSNVAWTSARHFSGSSHFWGKPWRQPYGNLLFADGSVQTFVNTNLGYPFSQTGLATNRLAIP